MAVYFPDIPQSVDPAETHINYFFDHLIACLNQRRVTLLDIARDTRLEIAARRTARAREEEELIRFRADTERGFQMNSLRDTQIELLSKLDEKLAGVRKPCPETFLVFRGDPRELEQLIQDVGELAEEEVPTVPRYQEMQSKVAVAVEGNAPGELLWPKGVAIDCDSGQIYIAEGYVESVDRSNTARVSVFSESGEFLTTFSHDHMKEPWGIAIHRNNIYVTDVAEHFVFHFKVLADFRLVARLGGKGSGVGEFDRPRQLAVSSNSEVFVSDSLNNRIQILDSDLHYQRDISHQSMTEPGDVKLTNEEVFILTSNSLCILVFSHAGDLKRSLITRGSIDDGAQIVDPWFFAIDAAGNFILSDWQDNRVKIFSKEGSLLHTLGDQGDQDKMLSAPHGIALTNNLKLVIVSLNSKYVLQIFSSE